MSSRSFCVFSFLVFWLPNRVDSTNIAHILFNISIMFWAIGMNCAMNLFVVVCISRSVELVILPALRVSNSASTIMLMSFAIFLVSSRAFSSMGAMSFSFSVILSSRSFSLKPAVSSNAVLSSSICEIVSPVILLRRRACSCCPPVWRAVSPNRS